MRNEMLTMLTKHAEQGEINAYLYSSPLEVQWYLHSILSALYPTIMKFMPHELDSHRCLSSFPFLHSEITFKEASRIIS